MKIITFISAANVFNQFAQTKIPVRLAYKIMKFCKSASTEEEFYNNKRNEIVNTYAVKDNDGKVQISDDGMINILPDKIAEANAAIQELNNIEIETPNIKFTLDELGELELSVADMYALDAFIE